MAYIGKEPQFTQYPSKFFNGDGTAMTVTLDYAPPNAAALLVFIDGVRQDTSAYTISAGTSLTFTGSVPSGTNNVQVVHLGLTQDVGVPSDDTISTAKIQDSAITSAKIADGAIVNADINASASIAMSKLATDPTNASNLASGTVPTARLGSGTASSSVFLRGDQSWASAGEVLTDYCGISAQSTFTSLTNNVLVTLAFDTEDYDVHGSMANLSNNRIDIKNAGYYVVGGSLTIGTDSGNESRYMWINHYDDSASTTNSGAVKDNIMQTSHSAAIYLNSAGILYLDVDDYLTMQGFSNGGSGPNTLNYRMYCGRIK